MGKQLTGCIAFQQKTQGTLFCAPCVFICCSCRFCAFFLAILCRIEKVSETGADNKFEIFPKLSPAFHLYFDKYHSRLSVIRTLIISGTACFTWRFIFCVCPQQAVRAGIGPCLGVTPFAGLLTGFQQMGCLHFAGVYCKVNLLCGCGGGGP